MKCAWKHCKLGNEIKDTDDYVKVSTKCYHTECNKERENINECISLFKEYINENVVMAQLRKVINTLIYTDGYSSDYVLFCIKSAVSSTNCKLNYPPGLFYVCKDQKMMESWKKKMAQEQLKDKKIEITEVESNSVEYHRNQIKPMSVADLFE